MQYPSDCFSQKDITSLRKAIENGKTISLITYVLGDSGEAKLKCIIESILTKYDRVDLMELLYTAAKELIANSTKAAIKRMIFRELDLDIMHDHDYRKGMEQFKAYMNEKKFPAYRKRMKENNFFIKISITHSPDNIRLYVLNNFSLIPVEEERVREKFEHAKKFDNLFEFFMAHGDNSEGAGMGITMVEILLTQSGYDRKNFQIISSDTARLTIAKVDVPMREAQSNKSQPNDQLIVKSLSLKEIKGAYL